MNVSPVIINYYSYEIRDEFIAALGDAYHTYHVRSLRVAITKCIPESLLMTIHTKLNDTMWTYAYIRDISIIQLRIEGAGLILNIFLFSSFINL